MVISKLTYLPDRFQTAQIKFGDTFLDIELFQVTQSREQLFICIDTAYSKNLIQIRMNYGQYYDNLYYVLQILKATNI